MRETEGAQRELDATVQEACPSCGGEVVTRVGQGPAWVYCRSCRRLSRSVLVPGPTGGSLLIHQLAAA